jgi:tetratricopeptide (TPR) repeat protein
MWMQRMIVVSLLGTVILAAGCNTYRKQVREEASDRVNLFNTQLTYDQAEQAFETGQLERALTSIDAAIARFDKAPAYHILRGRILLEMHQLDSAIGSFEKAHELDDQMAEPLYFKGIVLQRWSRDAEAFEAYRAAFACDTENVQYLLAASETLVAMSRFDDATALIEEYLMQFEYNSALRHLLGQIAMMQHDYPRAVDHLAQARLLRPEDMLLLEELAWAQYSAGLFSDCQYSVRQLRALESDARIDLMMLEGRCLAHMERSLEARELFRQVLKRQSGNVAAWVEYGAVSWDVDDYTRVDQAGEQLIARAPDRFEGYLYRGLAAMHRQDMRDAIRFFRKATDRSDASPVPFLLLGRAYEQAGQDEQARLTMPTSCPAGRTTARRAG